MSRGRNQSSDSEKELQRTSLDGATNAVVICDLTGHISWVNSAFSRMTGYSIEEAVSDRTRIFSSGKCDTQFYEQLWKMVMEGDVFQAEVINSRKDGTLYVERNTITPVRDIAGQVRHFIAVKEDVTATSNALAESRRSAQRSRLLFEYAPDAFYLHDLDGVFVDGNLGAEKMIGCGRQELIGKSFQTLGLLDENDLKKALECLELNRKGEVVSTELVLNRRDGRRVPMEVKTYPLEIDGRVLVLGIARDISERKASAARAQVLAGLSGELNEMVSSTRVGEVAAKAAARLFSWDACFIDTVNIAEGTGRRLFQQGSQFTLGDGAVPAGVFEIDEVYKTLLTEARMGSMKDQGALVEASKLDRDGQFMCAPMRHEGNVVGLIFLQRASESRYTADDLQCLQMLSDHCGAAVERVLAREALVESEANYRMLIERMPDAVFVHVNERIVFANAAAAHLAGLKHEREMIGRDALLFAPPEKREEIRQRLQRCMVGLENPMQEQKLCRADGTPFLGEGVSVPFTYRGKPAVQTIIRDVTGRRRIEEKLQHAQKLQAIGTLAGGIAHDFNNILGGIIGYSQLAQMDAGENPVVQEHLQHVLKAADRAKELVAQILTFSRQTKQERRPVRLAPVTKEVVKLIRAALPATIEVVGNIDAGAPAVTADTTQIHQVLMNLCTNASHAIGTRTGRIEVELARETITAESAAKHPGIAPGEFTRLTVSDNGHGIAPENLKRVFEPFFTTKSPWEGTGLGLAVVHGIVEQHGGIIEIHSELNRGTRVDVFLPATDFRDESEGNRLDEMPQGAGERILFVDDEPAVAETSRLLLERLGYCVTIELDPRLALDRFEKAPEGFDMVFTDLTMPGLTGAELALRILEKRPGMPVMVATGFNATTDGDTLRQLGVRDLVMKPLTPSLLAQTVRKALTGTVDRF